MEIKTCEQYVLAQLDAAEQRAKAYQDTLKALQKIFVINTGTQPGTVDINIRSGALNGPDMATVENNVALLISLFGDETVQSPIVHSSDTGTIDAAELAAAIGIDEDIPVDDPKK